MRDFLHNKFDYPCITDGCNNITKYHLMGTTIQTFIHGLTCEKCKSDLDRIEERTSQDSFFLNKKQIEVKIRLKENNQYNYSFEGVGYYDNPYDSIDTVVIGWGQFS